MNIKNLLFVVLTIFATTLFAQDKHFTLYDMAPLRINPANTGAFEGTVRVGGIYRDQSSLGNYRTPSFYADAPILMLGKRNWVGVGFLFHSDKAGSLELGETQAALSGAIHRMMDKKGKTKLTLGLQAGQVGRNIKGYMSARTGNEIRDDFGIPLAPDAIPETLTDMSEKSGLDFGLGLLLKSEMSKTTNLRVGVSFMHLLRPNYALNGSQNQNPNPNPNPNPIPNQGPDEERRPITTILHGGLDVDLNDKMTLNPSFFMQTTQGTPVELAVQAWVGYKLNEEKDIKFNFGLGYRASDAGEILLGMDYGDLRAALSYDITLSSQNDYTPAYASTGGFELSAFYIFKVFKKPVIKPAILCPKL